MTTDDVPHSRTGGLDSLSDGPEVERNTYREIKFLRTPSGASIQVRRWIDEDGNEGSVNVRISRKRTDRKTGEVKWDNLTLYGEDLIFMVKVVNAMVNQELLPMEEEIKF